MSLTAINIETKTHNLKTWPEVFDATLTRAKSFDIRKDDRDFAVGDIIRFREWDPHTKKYTGRSCRALITYLMPGGKFGVMPGYVCMSVRRLP